MGGSRVVRAGLGVGGRGPECREWLRAARLRNFSGLWEQTKAHLLWLEIRCPMHKHGAPAASHGAAGDVPAAAPTSTTPGHGEGKFTGRDYFWGLQHPNFLGG